MYEYDNAGNITAKKKYAFTTGTLGAVQATYTYSYNDSSWGDLLTSYDSTTIVYDEIGNPVRIGTYNAANDVWWDGYDLTWVGRQLMSYTAFYRYDADKELSYRTPVTFTYNADGIRTGKTTYGYEHKYYLDGTQITAEMWTQNNVEYLLYYLYDENGAPIGLQYRTSNYASGVFDFFFFDKNLQGDVIGIYNADGEKICTYTYDAWGFCNSSLTSGTSSLERSIAVTYNPFRYRGYYYDTETGLYYLQSRYYNPEWGRFLNADGYVSTGTGLLGYNMFAYCNNNPIMYVDPSGEIIIDIFLLVLGGAALVVGLSSCSSSTNQESYNTNDTDYSWAEEDPILSKGRHNSFEEALNTAVDNAQYYANNHDKEVGYYIYELYGGYYVSLPQSGILATKTSVKIDTSGAPRGSTVLATLHTHPWHNVNLIYQPIEYDNVSKTKIPSYVVDVCGRVYVLYPESNGYTDYTKIK